MTGLHAALAELAAEWADRTPRSDAPRDRRECAAVLHALLASHVPSGQVDHEQAYRDLRAGVEALVLAAWDDGNATGLDGWIGPERGEEPDPEGIRARERFADHAAALLTSSVPATASGGATEGSFGNPIRVPVADFVQRAIRDHPATGVASSDGSSKPGSSLEDAGSTDGDREGLSDEEADELDAILVALWQAETEKGYEFGRGRVHAAVGRALAARLAVVTAERDALRAEVEAGRRAGQAPSFSAFVERVAKKALARASEAEARAGTLAEQVAAVEAKAEQFECGGSTAYSNAAIEIRAALANPAPVLAARDAKVAAQAWDRGYSCGLGDCGKDQARETTAANPYRQRAAGGEVEQP